MPTIYLTPETVSLLSQPLLAACLAGYFLRTPEKDRGTWALTVFFGFAVAFFTAQALVHATVQTASEAFWRLTHAFGFPALVAMMAFAYAFPDPFRPREARWVVGLAGALTGAFALYVAGGLAWRGVGSPMPHEGALRAVGVALGLWAVLVFVRRARQPGPAQRAHRAFAGLFALVPLAVAALVAGGLLGVSSLVIHLVYNLTLLVFLAGFALIYINHAPRPTSFQVKLVGLSLFTVLAVLTVVNGVVFSTVWFEEASAPSVPGRHALRFEPTGAGAYRVTEVPYRPAPDGAEPVLIGEGSAVPLGFSFPFYGASENAVHVQATSVTLGQPWSPVSLSEFRDGVPKVAPLFVSREDRKIEAAIHRAPGEATVVWRATRAGEDTTAQARPWVHLRLARDGAVEFHYARGTGPLVYGFRGLYPGVLAPGAEPRWDVPLPQQSGPAPAEHFFERMQARQHERLAPLGLSFFVATGFIVLVFPLFFHASLVRPLERLLGGVQRVNAGDLDATVPVGVRDEIGRLTGHFNEMTGSLRQAHTELQDYAEHLEEKVEARTAELAEKNAENERLLLNILPEPIADRLKLSDEPIADAFADVTVLFADLVGFTGLSQRVDADRLVALLNDLFSRFDALALDLGVEKIKTIGDAYMAVCGLPVERPDHAEITARMAFGMVEAIGAFNAEHGTALELRVGLNTGPVVAGVIGTHKFIYDLWGDTVNTAARMESHGVPGRVHVTAATWARLAGRFAGEARGGIAVKGKGEMETYLLGPAPPRGPRPEAAPVPASYA